MNFQNSNVLTFDCHCVLVSGRYPAALATLADLEEVSPTESRPPALDIYRQSIDTSRLHYNDSHIYPYTYLGNYHYRRTNHKEALRNWAEAARVISRYMLNRAVNSAVRIVFFHFESNSYRPSQKVTSSKYLLNKFNCFYGTTLVSGVGVSVLGGP